MVPELEGGGGETAFLVQALGCDVASLGHDRNAGDTAGDKPRQGAEDQTGSGFAALGRGIHPDQVDLTGLSVGAPSGDVAGGLSLKLSDEDLALLVVATLLNPDLEHRPAAGLREMRVKKEP